MGKHTKPQETTVDTKDFLDLSLDTTQKRPQAFDFSETPYFLDSAEYYRQDNNTHGLVGVMLNGAHNLARMGNSNLATECFEYLLTLEEGVSYPKKADILWELGRHDEALQQFTNIQEYSEAGDFLAHEAERLSEDSRDDREKLLENALSQYLSHAELQENRQDLIQATVALGKAISVLEKLSLTERAQLMQQKKRHLLRQHTQSCIESGEKFQLQEALGVYEKLDDTNKAREVHILLAQYYEQCKEPRLDELQEAQKHWNQAGNPEEGIRVYERAKRWKEAGSNWKELAEHRENSKDVNGAKKAYQSSAHCYERESMYQETAAEMYSKAGDYEKAIQVLERAIQKEHCSYHFKRDCIARLATSYEAIGDADSAVKAYTAIEQFDQVGRLQRILGNEEEARAAYRKAAAIELASADSWLQTGKGDEHLTKAAQMLREACDPNGAEKLYTVRGIESNK